MKRIVFFVTVCAFAVACASSRNQKKGCVTTSANMGAERLLSGEKPEKQTKFKIKGVE